MNTSQQLNALGVVSALVLLGCALPGLGGPPVERQQAQNAIGDWKAPTLPYSGHGNVAILNDGMLIITLGGEFVVNQNVADYDDWEWEEVLVSPSQTIAFQMDTSGLSLCQAKHDGLFLDRSGAELAKRGLQPEQVVRTQFTGVDPESPQDRFAIVSLTGTLDAAFDDTENNLVITITDGETGHTLAFTGFVAAGGGTRTLPAPDTRVPLLPPALPVPSNCEITCTVGSCSISCEKTGCAAYCDPSGKPVCTCITHL